MEYEPCLKNGKRSSIKKVSGPDGLEAWCVAIAACLINFIMAGLGRMSGILYVAFIDIFHTDRMEASIPFSVRSSMRNLLGPIVGILGQKYGVCTVTVMGGLFGAISASFCFYADSILMVTILWGGINGIGTALTTTLPLVVIGQHFKKYRTTASGMAFSGGCVGSFLFPALLEYLLHTYSLPGTFLLIGGIIFHTVPAAMVLKSPTWMENENEIRVNNTRSVNTVNGHIEKSCQIANSERSSDKIMCNNSSVQYTSQSSVERSDLCLLDIQLLRQNMQLVKELLTRNFNSCTSSTISMQLEENCTSYNSIEAELNFLYSEMESFKISNFSPRESSFPLNSEVSDTNHVYQVSKNVENKEYRNEVQLDIHKSKAACLLLEKLFVNDKNDILKLYPEENERTREILDNLQYLHNIIKSSEDYLNKNLETTASTETDNFENISEREKRNTFWVHIKTAFRLHKNPLFLLVSCCRAVHFLTFVPVVTVIVDFAKDKGLPEDFGKYIIASLSFGDLLGRLGLGWLTDRELITLPRYMLIAMVLQGLATASLAFMETPAALMTMIAVFGLLQGSVFIRHPVLITTYLGSNETSVGMGCMNFFSGLLGFALPNYIGYFRDTIGSYNGMFYINGGIGILIGLLWLFEPFLLKFEKPTTDELTEQAV